MSQRKPYNPNTKYGRKKLREQYWENYENSSPEEQKGMDNTRNGCWAVILIIVIIITIIVFSTSGEEGQKQWLKWLSR